MDLRLKMSLPDDLLQQLLHSPAAIARVTKRWGKYMRAAARERILSGEGMAPLAASTQHKLEVTRTAKVTARGKVRASYAKQLGSYLESRKQTADADELKALLSGKSGKAAAGAGVTSKAVERLRKQLARYETTGKRVGGNRRKIQKHKLLGKLVQAFSFKVYDNDVVITNHIPWSGVHNLGGKVNNATLPARPFLFFSPENEARLAAIVAEEILNDGT